jgi:hypothetical protein
MVTWLASFGVRRLLTLVAVGLLAGAVWGYGHWRYNAGQAEAESRWEAATAEAGRKFAEALADQQAVLVSVEGDLERIRVERQTVRTVIREVYRNDPVASDWSRQPVPASVRDAAGRALGLPADPGVPAGDVPGPATGAGG